MTQQTVYPSWLTREDLPLFDEWEVQSGTATRGDAWTNIDKRRMRVPRDDSPLSRSIRAHELMHAKVSPPTLVVPSSYGDLDHNLVAACEEIRVNFLSRHVGNDVDSLTDGTEHIAAERMVTSGDGVALQHLIVSTFGTKVNDKIMRSIKKKCDERGTPRIYESAKALRKVLRSQTRQWSYRISDRVGSTTLTSVDDYGTCDECGEYAEEDCENEVHTRTVDLPIGFLHTLKLARLLENYSMAVGMTPDKSDGDKHAELPVGDEAFAPLIIRKLPMPERVAGRLGRRRVATDIGTNPRRIHRHLTDPERRIFDRRVRGLGAVILIDQSGSMHLSTDDLWDMIKSAPGATIIGYSHQPSSSGVPNTWVLAEGGHVVSEVPVGNGGNGVDGPALTFALAKRKKNEPFIWVCDGQVTSYSDGITKSGEVFCRNLVKKHNIHMVSTVKESVDAIKLVADGHRLTAKLTGPLQEFR